MDEFSPILLAEIVLYYTYCTPLYIHIHSGHDRRQNNDCNNTSIFSISSNLTLVGNLPEQLSPSV